jgi:hypothetical protein
MILKRYSFNFILKKKEKVSISYTVVTVDVGEIFGKYNDCLVQEHFVYLCDDHYTRILIHIEGKYSAML